MGKVLVTGATGFLGGAVAAELSRRGQRVVGLGRNGDKLQKLAAMGVPTLHWDLSTPNQEKLSASLAGVDAIVHCAALSAPFGLSRDFELHNVKATEALVSAAAELGVRKFIYISTPAVYFRFQDQIDLTEATDLPPPVNTYAQTKRAAEMMVLANMGNHPIVLRPRGIYGRGDQALLPRLLKAAAKGPLPLLRGGLARTDLTHVDDVVASVIAALGAGPSADGEIFNISGGEAIPIREVVERASQRLAIRPTWRRVPVRAAFAAASFMEWAARRRSAPVEPRVTRYGLGILAYTQTLNIEKAKRRLSWAPKISFDEGLNRTFGQPT